jgi:acyl-CoA dehydrogenase
MRLVGLAERALELAVDRGLRRTAFGERLIDLGGNRERIADARIAIEQLRLLVLRTAWLLDTHGVRAARSEISQIKVAAPRVAQDVVDVAIQLHGAGGLSADQPLAAAWANARSLRLADGPDEVHRSLVARLEVARHEQAYGEAR